MSFRRALNSDPICISHYSNFGFYCLIHRGIGFSFAFITDVCNTKNTELDNICLTDTSERKQRRWPIEVVFPLRLMVYVG